MTFRTARPIPRTPASRTTRNLAALALLFLATCDERGGPGRAPPASHRLALGTVPATEAATWRKVVSVAAPEGRFLQAVAFDKTRQVVVMFGGENRPPNGGPVETTQDMWEWSPTTGIWTLRTTSGDVPEPRAGAAMVHDPVRNKMLLFGGRSTSGYNYEDLWEWDPTTADWTERSAAGTHPAARAQLGMVFQVSTGKVLLFGGGRSSTVSDGTSVSTSLGDTWELDPAAGTWTALSPAASPGVRHDFGLVWDSQRDRAVLFGGMQIDIPGATGVPKQDTWEWDPAAGTWSERTLVGAKPSQRYGHAMAFDTARNRVVLFGGWDMQTTRSKNDLWDWDAVTGAWTEVLSGGSEPGLPSARSFASLVYDSVGARLDLVAGQVSYTSPAGMTYGLVGSNEVWELDAATATFTDRSTSYRTPNARAYHEMAYNPATGKSYIFGGVDPMLKGTDLVDLWEWDGSSWSQVATDSTPPARVDGAMAYDPARQSLILFGGNSWSTSEMDGKTWEWSGTTRQWTALPTQGSPEARWGHAMVTDTIRKKILLYGGGTRTGGATAGEVWEWDGATLTWTRRSPVSANVPVGRNYPAMSFDEDRGKLMLYDGSRSPSFEGESTSAYWEWDVGTGGWALIEPGDVLGSASNVIAVYDSARRRHVLYTDATINKTWELDAKAATWFVRTLTPTPESRFRGTMVYDSGRRVAVLFGGTLATGTSDDLWEYDVGNLGNGAGCLPASAATCASGNCVDGVCCDTAGCSGACKSCNVPGSEGTCVLVEAGTEVPGSCADGQACDGTGACKSKNGQTCQTTGDCASGFCVDGVCCDGACTGACKSCAQVGRVGRCTPFAAGSDPRGECGQGTGVCKSTCDGVGECAFPQDGVSCGACLTCDGAGTCGRTDPACAGGSGGSVPGKGGAMGEGGKSSSGGTTSSGGVSGSQSGGSVGSGGSRSGGSASGGSVGSGGSRSGGSQSAGGTQSGGSSGSAGSAGAIPAGTGGRVAGTSGAAGRSGTGGAGGGSTAIALDGGAIHRDGGGDADGGLLASLHRGGCSCEVGQGQIDRSGFASFVLLVGAGWWWRRRKGNPRRG